MANRADGVFLTCTHTHPCAYSRPQVHTPNHGHTLVHMHAQSQAHAHTHTHTLAFSSTCVRTVTLTYLWHRHSCTQALTCTHLHPHTLTHSCEHTHILCPLLHCLSPLFLPAGYDCKHSCHVLVQSRVKTTLSPSENTFPHTNTPECGYSWGMA